MDRTKLTEAYARLATLKRSLAEGELTQRILVGTTMPYPTCNTCLARTFSRYRIPESEIKPQVTDRRIAGLAPVSGLFPKMLMGGLAASTPMRDNWKPYA